MRLEETSAETDISTHTLTWSVTKFVPIVFREQSNFNSHAHVERDVQRFNLLDKQIHFNSHAHVERDPYLDTIGIARFYFNSHAHVERDT